MRTEQSKSRPFEHVHAQKAVLYRRIMRVFSDAKRRFLVHLRPEDVGQTLEPTVDEGVEGALTALVEWGNLRADPDTSRVTTVEDFYRARYLYQLTPEGEAAEVALAAYENKRWAAEVSCRLSHSRTSASAPAVWCTRPN